MIHPMILKQSGSRLWVSNPILAKLKADPRPILWCNDGLYAMIPIDCVRNEIAHSDDIEKVNIGKQSPLLFHWSAAVEIPQETGRAMEKYNGGKISA